MNSRFRTIAAWFDALTEATLPSIDGIYASDAHFKDPFNDVRGIARVNEVYQHMFDGLDEARFTVDSVLSQGGEGFFIWRFHCKWRKHVLTVHGSSHLVLDDNGLIAEHRDYWDTGEELYEKIPGLGAVLRGIKKRLALPA